MFRGVASCVEDFLNKKEATMADVYGLGMGAWSILIAYSEKRGSTCADTRATSQ